MSRTTSAVTSVLTTTLVLIMLVAVIDTGRGLEMVFSADPLFLAGAFILANTTLLVNSIVWKKVLKGIGIELSYLETIQVVLTNTFINNITPFGNTGGEPVITYYLAGKFDQSKGRTLSAVLTAEIINFSPLLTSALAGATAYSPLTVSFIFPAAFKDIKTKIIGEYRQFKKGLSDTSLDRNDVLRLVSITHISVGMDILAVWMVMISLGLNVALIPLLFIVPLARIANYTPLPGGTGPYELALSGLLVYFYGIPAAGAISAAVLYRTITYYFGILAGSAAAISIGIGK